MITQTNTRQIEPDITVTEISGRLSLGNTLTSMEDSLRKLIREGARKLIVDLKGLQYIDSSGIGMIVVCTGEMNQVGGQMRVAGAQGVVAPAFDVVRLNKVVPHDPDVETAQRALSDTGAVA